MLSNMTLLGGRCRRHCWL